MYVHSRFDARYPGSVWQLSTKLFFSLPAFRIMRRLFYVSFLLLSLSPRKSGEVKEVFHGMDRMSLDYLSV